jgi:hypothetical protein
MDRKSNCTPFLLCLLVILTLLFSPFYPSPCLAKKVTLGWDPNPEPDLEGYVVYRNVGSPGPPYKHSDTLLEDDLADPLNPRVTLTGLNEKKEYYIAVTAYDTKGNESYFSDDVCVEIVNSVIENCSASLSPGSRSSSGRLSSSSGGSCFISTVAGGSNALPVILCSFIVMGLALWIKSLFKISLRNNSSRKHEIAKMLESNISS